MKKVVLKVDLHDDKAKQKAMKTVSTLSGVDSIAIDMKEGKLTVIGNIDPVTVVGKLRKSGWHAELLIVGPAKEEKKEEAKKEETKKEEAKKEEAKKSNINPNEHQIAELMRAYSSYYNPPPVTHYYGGRVVSAEEDPNSCVIS